MADDHPTQEKASSHIHVENAHHGPVPTAQSEIGRDRRERHGAAMLLVDVGARSPEADGQNELKLAQDARTVLIPQPSDDLNDPLNWSSWKKHAILITVGMCAVLLDFQVGASIACTIPQGFEWHMEPDSVNRAGNLSVIMIAIGGILSMPFLSSWGRAPVVFWTVLAGTLLSVGCALSPNFRTYYGMKAVQTFFFSSGLVAGLAYIEDMFYFHERARKIGLWTSMWLAAPYFGPMFGNFITTRTHEWRNVFWLIVGIGFLDVLLILLFLDESWYRRDIPLEDQPLRGLRIWRVLGIWQMRAQQKYFGSYWHGSRRLLGIFLEPLVIPASISTGIALMWAIGINQTSSILLATPVSVGGYGFNLDSLSYVYFAPILGIIVGELFGHWLIDFVAKRYIHHHRGVFAPEARLWPIYISTCLMAPGLVVAGQALQKRLSWVAIAFGWAIYVAGAILEAVAITAYVVDSYPHAAAELSALLNFVRLLTGFSVGYFQIPWGTTSGFDVSFGIQAALVIFSTLIMVPLHIFGPKLRMRGGPVRY